MTATVLDPEYQYAKRMRQAALDVCPAPKLCPFCGGDSLLANDWATDEGEVPAFECTQCEAAAPARVWNRREG